MEHLDAFKVENVDRILSGKIPFPNETTPTQEEEEEETFI